MLMALSDYEITHSVVMIEFSMVSAIGNYYLFLISRPFQPDKLLTLLKY